MDVPTAHLITLYVILLGPLKVFGIYGKATVHADRALRQQIANQAVGVATLVSVLLAVLGGFLMSRFEISIGILAVVMGVFLAHWAWGRAMGINAPGEEIPDPENPTKALAIFPIAFPGIVPPQGVALLVLSSTMTFEALGADDIWIVVVTIIGVMAVNWISFRAVKALMKFPGLFFWTVLARTLGVIAVGMSFQIILFGLKDIGVIN